MTPEERTQLLSRLDAAGWAIGDARIALMSEPSAPPPEATPVGGSPLPAAPAAVIQVGEAKTRAGQGAVVPVTLTCAEPLAGLWLNLRHSPRLTAKAGDTPLTARAFKFEKAPDHSRTLIMFSSDLRAESAGPGNGLVQLPPETVVLRVTYAVAEGTPAGRYPVDGGTSGIAGGGRRTSWPTLLLNWGRGGLVPEVEGGWVEVVG